LTNHKSFPIDAEAAARAVLAGTASTAGQATRRHRGGHPDASGGAERATRGPHRGHQPAQRAARHRPSPLPEDLDQLSGAALVATCTRLRPDQAALADPVHASTAALGAVACRIDQLDEEIGLADQRLAKLVGRAAPRRLKLHAIGSTMLGSC
jgi:transposase